MGIGIETTLLVLLIARIVRAPMSLFAHIALIASNRTSPVYLLIIQIIYVNVIVMFGVCV